MDFAKPKRCAVVMDGKEKDLLGSLKETKVMGQKAWRTTYKVNRPGLYTVYMEPMPYWEPAEDCFIVHYTKTVIGAFGEEEGWDGVSSNNAISEVLEKSPVLGASPRCGQRL